MSSAIKQNLVYGLLQRLAGYFFISGYIISLSLFSKLDHANAGETDSATQLYLEFCSVCHGEKGDAKSHARQGLMPPPLDFTTKGIESWLTRKRMIDAVTNGKPGTAMAGWKTQLNEKQIGMIVDYIRTNFMNSPQLSSTKPQVTENQTGQKIYAETCSVCHGEDGRGALWGKTSLNPQPVNFTDPTATKYLTRERMIASVSHGRPGTAMTAFATQLSPTQIEAVVDYIQSAFFSSPGQHAGMEQMSERAASTVGMAVLHGQTEAIDNTHRSVIGHEISKSLAIDLKGDAATGKAYFIQNCTACHGINGDGKGPRAYFIFPKPRNFQDPEFHKQLSRPQLFNAIKNGVLGREMPAWGKVLTDQQIMDITEYMFQTFLNADQQAVTANQKPH